MIEPTETSDVVGIAASNAINPDAPEFQKGYKRENNTGCCGICGSTGCVKDHANDAASIQIIRQRNTRDDFVTEV